ncbi:alpha-hydroxy acid oxidase [Pollutimonas bauzanensis]|uniref:(S)-mandelate dehydrogenase n=1 Tax=Pollutimonas bauzanensis TaxID=658167 RepID=A0A1M5ZY26_9BURK|nr:alpha-hydroxy acid oxidase [Pollutimonas bauzanensis]SHI29151.1 (S)-mandelate dehydrogenase [Pollutimonas bauzanensis]
MNIDSAVNLDDIRKLAKKKLPKIAFDFLEGGVDDERCLERNRKAFERHALIPRYLRDVSRRDQSMTLLGRSYSSPFGISPTGMGGLFRPKADLMLAEAAAQANIPYLMSSASNDSLEAAARLAPRNTWFQMYGTLDDRINADMVRRARDAGIENLVITVDVPVNSNRERNRRNGFSRPLKMTPAIVMEALGHPLWIIRYLMTGGVPMMENWAPYAPEGATPREVGELFGTLTPAAMVNWETLERFRGIWPGKMVVKGILHPDDALQAVRAGADGIIVSNHGGRQLDAIPSPVEMLPAIRGAVGDEVELMLDSGVRRGSDIIIAICLGARFAFFGRPPLYAVAAAGAEGIQKTIQIMQKEIDMVMAQIGCASLTQLHAGYLYTGSSA